MPRPPYNLPHTLDKLIAEVSRKTHAAERVISDE
jgi:hypothetical protein